MPPRRGTTPQTLAPLLRAVAAAACTGAAAGGARGGFAPLCCPSLPGGGRWGNVLGTETRLPVNGSGGTERWDDPESRLGRVVAFALAAVVERLGRCRECSHLSDPRVVAVEWASRQLATYTRDGETPLPLRFKTLEGEERDESAVLCVMWTLRLVTEARRAQWPPPATAAEHAAAAAHRRAVHDVALHGDREGRFSVVRHTWQPGDPAWRPPPRRLWTPPLERWYSAARPRVHGQLLLVCYNIWNFNGDWGARSGLVAQAMARPFLQLQEAGAQIPDIVAVQEVRHDNGGPGDVGPEQSRHQVDHLLWRMAGMGVYQAAWVPAMSYVQVDRGGLSYQTEGPALFTRLPVLRTDALQLTRHWPDDSGDEHQRLCLGATVLTEGLGPINVLTSHLSLSDDARLSNVYEICRWAREWEGMGGGAVTFLMGDLNMIPSDPAMKFLLGQEKYRGETCDFRDVWDLAASRVHELGGQFEQDGITFNNLDEKPKKRIDFVLVRGPVSDTAFPLFEVVGSKAHTSEDKMPPSDHLGLRVTVDPRGGAGRRAQRRYR